MNLLQAMANPVCQFAHRIKRRFPREVRKLLFKHAFREKKKKKWWEHVISSKLLHDNHYPASRRGEALAFPARVCSSRRTETQNRSLPIKITEKNKIPSMTRTGVTNPRQFPYASKRSQLCELLPWLHSHPMSSWLHGSLGRGRGGDGHHQNERHYAGRSLYPVGPLLNNSTSAWVIITTHAHTDTHTRVHTHVRTHLALKEQVDLQPFLSTILLSPLPSPRCPRARSPPPEHTSTFVRTYSTTALGVLASKRGGFISRAQRGHPIIADNFTEQRGMECVAVAVTATGHGTLAKPHKPVRPAAPMTLLRQAHRQKPTGIQ